MKVKKAIIPVAGWGTRWLPITKTIEKCMLPIGNRPAITYLVDEMIAAGIVDFYFVVGESSTQLQSYYSRNRQLEDYLVRNNKADQIPDISLPENVQFHFVVQPSYGKYGTAVPVDLALQAMNEIDDEIMVVMGDNFFYNADGSSDIARLIEQTPDGQAGILGTVADNEFIPKYGHIVADENNRVINIIEHPEPLPEPFIKNVSMYILNRPLLMSIQKFVKEDRPKGEYGIFTPFEEVLSSGQSTMQLIMAKGMYLDFGEVKPWLRANRVILGDI